MKLQTHSWPASYGQEARPRMGFFTDTSVCIGCKACEVACKEWNRVPDRIEGFSGHSYDNSLALGADRWRHVAFVEQRKPLGADAAAESLVEAAERAVTIVAKSPCSSPRSAASSGLTSQNSPGWSSARYGSVRDMPPAVWCSVRR